jgi:DNA-directed RNA polymerase subunit RPC12/RpoP
MSSMIRFKCPLCKTRLKHHAAHETIACPGCGGKIRVPTHTLQSKPYRPPPVNPTPTLLGIDTDSLKDSAAIAPAAPFPPAPVWQIFETPPPVIQPPFPGEPSPQSFPDQTDPLKEKHWLGHEPPPAPVISPDPSPPPEITPVSMWAEWAAYRGWIFAGGFVAAVLLLWMFGNMLGNRVPKEPEVKYVIRYWNNHHGDGGPADAYFQAAAATSSPTVYSRGKPIVSGRSLTYVDWETDTQRTLSADNIIVDKAK